MKEKLENYYRKYNRRCYIHPDPLEFLYRVSGSSNIEITGIIASCMAFGRVPQILKTVSSLLEAMENDPALYLKNASEREISKKFRKFRYRFVGGKELTAFFVALKRIIHEFGSIENCFMAGASKEDGTIFNGLLNFDKRVRLAAPGDIGYLFADPLKGSGCKRFNLFLRWMIRRDEVDPGIWTNIPPSKLIVPVDTHMLKISRKLGLTKRKQGSMKTALEITGGFARICPDDPVRYDFALTRLGIRSELSIDNL